MENLYLTTMMILNTLLVQPAQYMNSSFKKALSFMYAGSDHTTISTSNPLTEEAPSVNLDNSLMSQNNFLNEKEQIFQEIKNLLDNF